MEIKEDHYSSQNTNFYSIQIEVGILGLIANWFEF